ncbi:hypothetical protein GCM10009800_34570 [Nocardiopsis rhodophaea]
MWLFAGDVGNRSTVAYRCSGAACDRISRTQVVCDLCEKVFADSGLAIEEFRALFVPDRNRVNRRADRPPPPGTAARNLGAERQHAPRTIRIPIPRIPIPRIACLGEAPDIGARRDSA